MLPIAIIQMASGPNVQANLMEASRLVSEACQSGAKMVVLPETFAMIGSNESDRVAIAEKEGSGAIQSFLYNLAIKYKIWVIGGTIPIISEDPLRPYASMLMINDQGEQVARYDKIHLFDVQLNEGNESYVESKTTMAGNQTIVVDTPFGQIGMAVCYDLRFPEQFRTMAKNGAEIFILPAAFTEITGKAHWEPLLRARAIENICYMIASAQGGYHISGRCTHGNSMMIDYWGKVHERVGKGSGVIIVEMDLNALHQTRSTFPVLQHIR